MTVATALPDPHDLITEYQGLAHSIAQQQWRNAPHALELEELRGIANYGLVDAAMKWEGYCAKNSFDPWQLQYFKPYVARRVYGAIIDAIRKSDWGSRSLRERSKALQEAGADRGATEAELSRKTGLTITEIRQTRRYAAQKLSSLDAEQTEPMAVVAGVESTLITGEVLNAVVAAVRGLPRDEQAVLALHYYGGLQLREVARALGLPSTRASKLHASAVTVVHAAMVEAAEHAIKGEF